jgi:peptide/nickel transport system permease protein
MYPEHFILPIVSLSLSGVAGFAIVTRAAMIEVLSMEYIQFAISKGQKHSAIVWKHAFRNALVMVVTFAGVYFANFLSMAFFAEIAFAIPGISSILMNLISARDVNSIQSIMMLFCIIIVVLNLSIDILYGFLDPRIRSQYK